MTASHSSPAGGLTPLFSVLSPSRGANRLRDHDDDIAEIVDDASLSAQPIRAAQRAGTFNDASPEPPRTTAPVVPSTPRSDVVDAETVEAETVLEPAAVGGSSAADAAAPTDAAVYSYDSPGVMVNNDDMTDAPEEPIRHLPASTERHLPAAPMTTDGLPLALDVYAVTARAVVVLIGTERPAEQIAKTAIGLSIESEKTAAIDVVVPRAIDLVLYRAKALVNAGIAQEVVEDYESRLVLWRRLSVRSGLEPAAIVLGLAPFPTSMIASMLRVSLDDVEAVLERWNAGLDPDPNSDVDTLRPAQITMRSSAPADAPVEPAIDDSGADVAAVGDDDATAVVENEPSAGAVVDAPSDAPTDDTHVEVDESPAKEPAAEEPTAVISDDRAEPAQDDALAGGNPVVDRHDVARYARASFAASAPTVTEPTSTENDSEEHGASFVASDGLALDAFLRLPDGRGSRLRQMLRRKDR